MESGIFKIFKYIVCVLNTIYVYIPIQLDYGYKLQTRAFHP